MPTILITGANRGLGLGLARAFHGRGWTVHAAVRDPAAASGLDALGPDRVIRHPVDLENLATIDALATQLKGTPIDILVSNAALTGGELGAFGSFDADRFLRACLVNAAAPMRLIERFADHLAAGENRLAFVLSSRIGANPFYGYAEYFASKSALNQIVKQASIALAPSGIAVVAAHPGWVGTDATSAHGQAPLNPDSSAALLVNLMLRLRIEDSGRFFDPDGSELPLVTQQTEVKFYSKPLTATR